MDLMVSQALDTMRSIMLFDNTWCSQVLGSKVKNNKSYMLVHTHCSKTLGAARRWIPRLRTINLYRLVHLLFDNTWCSQVLDSKVKNIKSNKKIHILLDNTWCSHALDSKVKSSKLDMPHTYGSITLGAAMCWIPRLRTIR
jgi:hypothetical protein